MPLNTSHCAPSVIAPEVDKAFHYSYFRSIEAAGTDWDAAAPGHDIFLQREYLSVLEHNPPVGMRFGYLVFYKGTEPLGVALVQIKYFKGDEHFNETEPPTKDPCFFTGLAQWLKRRVAGKISADILVCGNLLLTGEHGYWFDYTRISTDQAAVLLEEALQMIVRNANGAGERMPVVLVKDLVPAQRNQGQHLVRKGYVEFEIQPSMILPLPFRDFEEYLAAMSTKYRTRAKRAFKKAQSLVKKELSLAEIQQELPRMYALYKDIANNAGFNMVDLNVSYLPALKRDMPGHFRLFGYYQEDRLLAFYTVIQNGEELEAHFLGYDKHVNHEVQLYLNILYDIVRLGIEAGCQRVVFARTALEIKSSVGAVPHDLYCYLRHQNPLTNKFTGTLLDYLKPVEEWQPRHPFKSGVELEEEQTAS